MENKNEIILYKSDNSIQLEVRVEGETVWLSQNQMGLLFDRNRTVIGRHIRNIFEEGELDEKVVCAKFAHTTLPPVEDVFCDGQIFDAYKFVSECLNRDFNMIFLITLIVFNLENQINLINQGSNELLRSI